MTAFLTTQLPVRITLQSVSMSDIFKGKQTPHHKSIRTVTIKTISSNQDVITITFNTVILVKRTVQPKCWQAAMVQMAFYPLFGGSQHVGSYFPSWDSSVRRIQHGKSSLKWIKERNDVAHGCYDVSAYFSPLCNKNNGICRVDSVFFLYICV